MPMPPSGMVGVGVGTVTLPERAYPNPPISAVTTASSTHAHTRVMAMSRDRRSHTSKREGPMLVSVA